MKKPYLIIGLIFSYFFSPIISQARGFQTFLGLGFIEGGDDRWQTASKIEIISDSGLKFDLTYSATTFGPFSQSTYLFSIGNEFSIFYSSNLYAQFGLAYLADITELNFSSLEDQTYNQRDQQQNIGLAFGCHWRSDTNDLWQYGFSWTSYVFAAGPIAGLFLATGRRQTISASVGIRL